MALLEGASLFLDLDGTLLDLRDDPADVIADAALRALLLELQIHLSGRLAIVSGRSLAQIDSILGPLAERLAVSGSHGSELRAQGVAAAPSRPASLDIAACRLNDFADGHDGVLVERKSFGVAIHYRMCPDAGPAADRLAAQLAEELGLHLQEGKMMRELRVPGADKGRALDQMMRRPPMRGGVPLFVGDDRTDEPAFEAAAALGGAGILIGEPRETAARYSLADPAALRHWLAGACR